MKAIDLVPPQRRLLRRAGRVDPNPTKLDPRDQDDAAALVDLGLVAYEAMFGGRYQGVRITDSGRRAL